MDQVSQAVLGGLAAQLICGRKLGHRAWIAGAVAATIPDLDVFLQPLGDPAFPIEIHRTWSHAIAVTPLGALLSLAVLLPWRRFRTAWKTVYLACFVGWLTHGPLDACTSYGTKLWLPFDDRWVAWDLIAIIDPLFTTVLIFGLVLTVRRARRRPGVIALGLAVAYLGFGMVQRDWALETQARIAKARGHHVLHARAFPQIGSLFIWRTLYRTPNRNPGLVLATPPYRTWPHQIEMTTHLLVPFQEPRTQIGRDPHTGYRRLPFEATNAVLHSDAFDRFWEFADGFVAFREVEHGFRFGDARFCVGYDIKPIWGMEAQYDEDGGVALVWHDLRSEAGRHLGTVAKGIFGQLGTWRPLEEVLAEIRRSKDPEGE